MRFDISPWVGLLSAVWLSFFLLGKWQFNRVKQGTIQLILSEGRRARSMPQRSTVEELFWKIQPAWESMLKKNAWFILHKSELFPVPALPAIVQKRLNFTPAWMGAYLRLNGVSLPADPDLEILIEHIMTLTRQKKGAKNEKL